MNNYQNEEETHRMNLRERGLYELKLLLTIGHIHEVPKEATENQESLQSLKETTRRDIQQAFDRLMSKDFDTWFAQQIKENKERWENEQ